MTQSSIEPQAEVARRTMRTAMIAAPGRVEVRNVPIPKPYGTDVRVKIEGCGVCASNIPPWEGREWFRYPLAPGQLGHEAWGRIDAVGADVLHFAVGERVALLSERSYAEYEVAAEDKVIALPTGWGDTPFPAEPLGCAMNMFHRCGIRAGQTVAIVGIGFLGALLTRLASQANASTIAISRRPFSLEVAAAMGAAHTLALDDPGRVVEEVRQITGGTFCDVVIEAVGMQGPLDLAGEITRERGRLVIGGYHQDGPRSVNLQLWNWRGLDVINAHERDPRIYLRGMADAIDAIASGELDPTPLYTHRYPLERLGDALDAVRERPEGFLKALVMM